MTEKLKLDLPLVLPDERDACVGRLTELLQAEGLEVAHLVRGVLVHEGSSLVVVINALRLLAYPDEESAKQMRGYAHRMDTGEADSFARVSG